MKRVTLLLVLTELSCVKLLANTIRAPSPTLRDVQAAVNSARNDDTVIIPAGTATWTGTLLITRGITLMGQTTTDPVAGTAIDKTIIQDNVTRGAGGTPLIKVQSVLGQTYRISGLTFQAYSGMTKNNFNGAVMLRGNSHAVRLDHCHFQPMPAQAHYVGVWGPIHGVADHNVMECPHAQSFLINMGDWPNPDGSAGQFGDGSWAAPTGLGSEIFFLSKIIVLKTSPEHLPSLSLINAEETSIPPGAGGMCFVIITVTKLSCKITGPRVAAFADAEHVRFTIMIFIMRTRILPGGAGAG